MATNGHLLALDVGDRRVGVALASLSARLPFPLTTLINDQSLASSIRELIDRYSVQKIIAGLPTSSCGQPTEQTNKISRQLKELKTQLSVPIVTQDESLSSVRAEEELKRRGKIFKRADIDKLAACLILEDYISNLDHEV